MAKGPGPALLLAAVAALFLLKGKKGGGDTAPPKDDDPGSKEGKPDTGTPEAPKAKSQKELETEFDPEYEGETEITEAQIIAEAQWKQWPAGTELTNEAYNHDHNLIYASADCEAALMGRDWNPVIEFEDKLYDPAAYWRAFGDGNRPNEKLEEVGGQSHARWFADKLLTNRNAEIDCEVEVPNRKDYDTDLAYDNAWTEFVSSSPAFKNLYQLIYHYRVKDPMMAAWAEDDPDAHREYQIYEIAEWAVDTYPNEDVTEQTDQAYFHGISGDEAAPQVLDPDNPDHEEYIGLWIELNEAIKSL